MVEYLGFILSPEGLHMDPAKVSTIQAWPVPHNVHEVQSFLGFTNVYQRFISGYAEFTQPLTNLCQKNTPWHFGEPESTAFQSLKMAFHTAPVLYHWAPDLPMTVETDASDYAIAGILSVTTPNPSMMQQGTTTPMTRGCWQSLPATRLGDTGWSANLVIA